MLWATKHSSTNLAKDEEWLALLAEEQDANPPAENAEVSSLETIDNPEPGEEAGGDGPTGHPGSCGRYISRTADGRYCGLHLSHTG